VRCPTCGSVLDTAAESCGQCGWSPPPAPLSPPPPLAGLPSTAGLPAAVPVSPAVPGPSGAPGVPPATIRDPAPDGPAPGPSGAESLVERLTVGRPTSFPSASVWLKTGIFRNWRGVAGALVAAWFYLPAAFFFAVTFALLLGGLGLVYGGFGGADSLPDQLANIPFLGDAMQNLAARSGGILLAAVGVMVGAVLGFILGLAWLFLGPFQDGLLTGVATIVGALAAGVVAGLLYTLYRVVCEGWILRITGARRPSRREAEFLLPMVRDCARRLGLSNHPPLLIDDTREPNALAYTRHVVINQGLLEEFNYDREAVAAVICHELVHWRNGDAISAAFVRGVALPLYMVQAGAGWLRQRASQGLLRFLVWTVFWPVFVTVQYVVVPLQAADSRRAEYWADEGAVRAGHRTGMRRVLARFRQSFEGGRNGWVAAVCASHPPNELRLESIEEPGVRYSLPDAEAPPLPLPVLLAGEPLRD
jgi:Zn-dependent protease with chaperone function